MHFLKTLLVSIVLLGSLCSKKPPQPPTKIRSQQLMYEYLPNLGAGDVKYKGKELLVKGSIVKAEPENGVVMLQGIPSGITNVVVCHFADDITRNAITDASENQEIIVQGVNTGWSYEGVHLRPCRISKDQ